MTPRTALRRIAVGLFLLAALYVAPWSVGALTAGKRLATCPVVAGQNADIVLQLPFVPNSTEIEELQRYGRYGGSGGNMSNVVLLRVTPADVKALSHLYWVDKIVSLDPCKTS